MPLMVLTLSTPAGPAALATTVMEWMRMIVLSSSGSGSPPPPPPLVTLVMVSFGAVLSAPVASKRNL